MFKVRNFDQFIEGFKSKNYSLDNAPVKFFKDKKTVLKMAPHDNFGALYNYLPKKFQKDEKFMSQLVNINGYMFLKANRFHENNDMALSAVKTCPDAAAFLNLNGENGYNIAKEAVDTNAFAYRHLKNFTDDSQIIISALSSQGILYRYLSPQNQCVEDYAKVALASTPFAYRFLPKELQPSVELASIAISADKGYAYSIYKDLLIKEVQADPYVSALAVSKNIQSIKHVPNDTYADPGFQQMLGQVIDQAKENFREQNDEEGLINYEQKINYLMAQKNEEVLEERLNQIFSEKQNFDGVCEVSAENVQDDKNFVAPIDRKSSQDMSE